MGKDLKSKKNRGNCRCRESFSSKMKENRNCLGSFHMCILKRVLMELFLIGFLGIPMPSVACWCGICSDAFAVQVCRGGEEASSKL